MPDLVLQIAIDQLHTGGSTFSLYFHQQVLLLDVNLHLLGLPDPRRKVDFDVYLVVVLRPRVVVPHRPVEAVRVRLELFLAGNACLKYFESLKCLNK